MLLLCKLSFIKCYQEQILILVITEQVCYEIPPTEPGNSNIILIFQQHISCIHRNNTSKGILGSMPSQCKECTLVHLLLNSNSPCFITIIVFSDVNFLTFLYIPKCKCFLSHTFLECVILHLGQCLWLIISKFLQYSTCLTLGRHPLWVVPPDKRTLSVKS